jgi:hypothetical protein
LVLFFPLAIAVKNGSFLKIAIFCILIDIFIFCARKKLVPILKSKFCNKSNKSNLS